jgi:tRNA(Arg) A34 adenosine deaminase TadA
MRRAIDLAEQKMRANFGGPFGALIVRDGTVVAEGWNMVTSTNDPTAHAEIVAIRKACTAVGNFNLTDCDIFTSCEPCPMCLGAIYWTRLRRVFFCSTRFDAAKIGFDDEFIYQELAVPLEERRIETVRIFDEKADLVFEEWARSTEKVRY